MTRHKRFLALLAFGLVLGLVVLGLTPEREPVYKGRPLSEWLSLQNSDGQQEAAQQAIRAIGTNAIPMLIKRLAYNPENHPYALLCKIVSPKATQSRILAPLFQSNSRRIGLACEAMDAMDTLGAAATPAIPSLTKIADGRCGIPAARAILVLKKLGQPGFAALALIENHPNYPSQSAVDMQARVRMIFRVEAHSQSLQNRTNNAVVR